MRQPAPAPSQDLGTRPASDGESLRDAAHWWEPRRLLYNAVLSVVFVALVARTWERIRPELTASAILPLIVLCLLANVCYSAAYLLDFPLQAAFAPPSRDRWRWATWTLGMLCAVLIETYWYLDEILPPIR